MTVQEQFNSFFDENNLKNIFSESVIYSKATGIDHLNSYSFKKQSDEQIAIISRKVIDGTYKFSKYKLKLISKGRGKVPREISISTIRDRVVLKALCNFLQKRFEPSINFQLPQDVIKDLKNEMKSGLYDGFIKLDVSNFYPSIRHDFLKKRLRTRIRSKTILDIIISALITPTVDISKSQDKLLDRGIPQGLSISNILATIYMKNIDKFLLNLSNTKCYRYVDDILILCRFEEAEKISKQVIAKFRRIGLIVHCPINAPDKSKIDAIKTSFDYLGYLFENDIISARNGSVKKLKSSLVSIFTSYKYAKIKSTAFLEWRLNLRISGCVFENKSKGWLFFFSEINDEKLLHCLDHYVKLLCLRFSVKVNVKKFVRTHKEINHRKYVTSYIPNFDRYNVEQMKDVLKNYFNFSLLDNLSDDEIEINFHKKIGKQVKDLEIDIKDFS